MDMILWVLVCVGSYIIASVFFLKWPILHQKKRLAFKCSHISHRGGGAEKLENTLEAYRNALKCGTQMLELDVHLTADGVVVVSHDDHLVRTTGEDICIKDTFHKELPMLSNSITVCEGVTCNRTGVPLHICTLEEVFKEFQGVPIHLDVKVFNLELIEKTSQLIRRYGRENITPWGSFSRETTAALHKLNPTIPLAFSTSRVIFVIGAYWLGLLPFLPIKESSFAIPLGKAIRRTLPPSYLLSKRVKIFFFALEVLLLRKSLIKHLRDRGINWEWSVSAVTHPYYDNYDPDITDCHPHRWAHRHIAYVYMWVANDDEHFKEAFELGATGVMTDYPSRLQKWLEANGNYRHEF